MAAQSLTISGKRYVMLPEREYQKLARQAVARKVQFRRAPDGKIVETVDAFEFVNQSIARRIRGYRKKAGMDQLQLAAAAGVKPETVRRIERGEGARKSGTIEKLIRAMGLDPKTA